MVDWHRDMQKMVNFLREHRMELIAVSIRAAEGLPGSRKQWEEFLKAKSNQDY